MVKIEKDFVFIVGAGASKEFGLPTGKELLEKVSKISTSKRDSNGFFQRYEFKDGVSEAIQRYARMLGNDNNKLIELYGKAGWLSSIALLAPSIDNVLHTHSADPDIVQIGKIFIAQALLESEQKSSIVNDRSRGRSDRPFPLTYLREGQTKYLSDTWLGELFRLLVEMRDLEEFINQLKRITFISFNYDRCIQQFLITCASLYFRITDNVARNRVAESINVIHPYGSLGSLTLQNDIIYGYGPVEGNIFDISQKIRTFTEGSESDDVRVKMHAAFENASSVFFLGFGFLDLNMDLLFQGKRHHVKEVFGTYLGMSDASVKIVKRKLENHLFWGNDLEPLRQAKFSDGETDAIKMENMSCGDLLRKYHFLLRS